LKGVKTKIESLLNDNGVTLNGFLYCPHYPEGNIVEYAIDCECRKPKPGMLIQAALRWHIDLDESWMLGDILNDVEAANRAGCKSILIDNGGETQWQTGFYRAPDYIAKNIHEAANYILNKDNERGLGGL
jgi:histidinol phosphatase-like enzyme